MMKMSKNTPITIFNISGLDFKGMLSEMSLNKIQLNIIHKQKKRIRIHTQKNKNKNKTARNIKVHLEPMRVSLGFSI